MDNPSPAPADHPSNGTSVACPTWDMRGCSGAHCCQISPPSTASFNHPGAQLAAAVQAELGAGLDGIAPVEANQKTGSSPSPSAGGRYPGAGPATTTNAASAIGPAVSDTCVPSGTLSAPWCLSYKPAPSKSTFLGPQPILLVHYDAAGLNAPGRGSSTD